MSATSATTRFSLHNRRALVTGSSRGIGSAIARSFAEAGADVAIWARSANALDDVADQIRAHGVRALPIVCDVTLAHQVEEAIERTWQELGPLDVLVNAAGGPIFQSPLLDVRADGWDRVLELNLTSVFRLCQQVGRRMVARKGGSIINVASVMPTRAWPVIGSYSAAKAGVVELSRSLAVELGAAGVRVNTLCPGWIRTQTNGVYLSNRRLATRAVDGVPLARWGDVDDVVGAAIWLASDASRYVTGASIAVDGGFSIGLSRKWLRDMRVE
jgi:NAD(P)-dependent dehydrogenase (short-subunit alcohol dehydrogenase family)